MAIKFVSVLPRNLVIIDTDTDTVERIANKVESLGYNPVLPTVRLATKGDGITDDTYEVIFCSEFAASQVLLHPNKQIDCILIPREDTKAVCEIIGEVLPVDIDGDEEVKEDVKVNATLGESKPKAKPEAKSEPVPAIKPESKPKDKPASEPTPDPKANPVIKPESKPKDNSGTDSMTNEAAMAMIEAVRILETRDKPTTPSDLIEYIRAAGGYRPKDAKAAIVALREEGKIVYDVRFKSETDITGYSVISLKK